MRRASELTEVAEGLETLAVWLRRLSPNTLSTTTMTTLGTLLNDGPLRISELAQREAMTQPGMTMLVNRLEIDGLAQRLADPTDRRAALVSITDAGRRIVADRRAARRDAVLAELDRLDAGARAALAAALPAIDDLVAPAHRTSTARSIAR